jgi:hypothetical protein
MPTYSFEAKAVSLCGGKILHVCSRGFSLRRTVVKNKSSGAPDWRWGASRCWPRIQVLAQRKRAHSNRTAVDVPVGEVKAMPDFQAPTARALDDSLNFPKALHNIAVCLCICFLL